MYVHVCTTILVSRLDSLGPVYITLTILSLYRDSLLLEAGFLTILVAPLNLFFWRKYVCERTTLSVSDTVLLLYCQLRLSNGIYLSNDILDPSTLFMSGSPLLLHWEVG